ncbi:hypothetical protein AB1Y20_018404 [Prymnesium parvum]|uniref:Uncharacterized protein n=1 Tax=Prymnesium parvum TaxID=97485 RepID=A0AB34JRT9_PRYPA
MAACSDDSEAALLCHLPSDTEAGVSYLLSQCPAAVRPRGLPVFLCSQLYAVVDDRTAVDRELEARRLAHELRAIQLPSSQAELLLLPAEQYSRAIAADAGTEGVSAEERRALECAQQLLPACTGVTVRRSEIEAALQNPADADAVAGVLSMRGWLTALPPSESLTLGDAPLHADCEWRWALPESGKLTRELFPLRTEVLTALHRQRFGRALRHTIERSRGVAALLRKLHIDLTFALRDLVGSSYIESTHTAAGTLLQLTAAGERAAASRKRRR